MEMQKTMFLSIVKEGIVRWDLSGAKILAYCEWMNEWSKIGRVFAVNLFYQSNILNIWFLLVFIKSPLRVWFGDLILKYWCAPSV